ncbi:hypothetical protein PFISCL1PPCAC_4880, partial [Pristionchus fissidentatus]
SANYRLFGSSGLNTNLFSLMLRTIISAKCEDLGPRYPGVTVPRACNAYRTRRHYKCKKGFYLGDIEYDDDFGKGKKLHGKDNKMKSMRCSKGGWQPHGSRKSNMRVTAFNCYPTKYPSETSCGATISFAAYVLSFDVYKNEYACYKGEKLVYTVAGTTEVVSVSGSMKLFCGKNVISGGFEWQWSAKDGTAIEAIPNGATMKCVKDEGGSGENSSEEDNDSGSDEE